MPAPETEKPAKTESEQIDSAALIEAAKQINALRKPGDTILPERMVTRPVSTSEHLVTEADLVNFENMGDGNIHTWAIFFLGGATSGFVPFIASMKNWYNLPGPLPLVDLITLVTFFVFLVLGIFLIWQSPSPNRKMKEICTEIRKRPAVDSKKFGPNQ